MKSAHLEKVCSLEEQYRMYREWRSQLWIETVGGCATRRMLWKRWEDAPRKICSQPWIETAGNQDATYALHLELSTLSVAIYRGWLEEEMTELGYRCREREAASLRVVLMALSMSANEN